jgi:hypothetical protein
MQRASLVALILFLLTFGAQARGPYGSITVGGWHGGAYTNDKSGSFSLRTGS